MKCHSVKCPKCGAESPCVDHCEVDIGVGIQTFDHKYLCPEHGRFAFASSDDRFNFDKKAVFLDEDDR